MHCTPPTTPLIEAALQVPAVCFGIEYTTPEHSRETFLPPAFAANLRGALQANLRSLSRQAAHSAARARYERALAGFRTVLHKLVLTDGRPPHPLPAAPYVAGVPWYACPVGPDMPMAIEIMLLGDTAQLWDVWAEAARALATGSIGVNLRARDLWVHSHLGTLPAHELAANPSAAVGVLADYVGRPPESADALRLHLLTPTSWGRSGRMTADPRVEISVHDLIWSAYTRLSMVTGLPPTTHEQELRDAILPSQVRIATRNLVAVEAWRPSSSRQGAAGDPDAPQQNYMRYGGLTGHLDLRRAGRRPKGLGLPPEFVQLLWVIQATHLGPHTTFGCGRVRIEIIEPQTALPTGR